MYVCLNVLWQNNTYLELSLLEKTIQNNTGYIIGGLTISNLSYAHDMTVFNDSIENLKLFCTSQEWQTNWLINQH